MKIVIIGLGNVLKGDDGLGIYVIKILESLNVIRKDINLIECGTSTLCVLNHMQNADKVIIVDSVVKGNKPGTIYYLKISIENLRLNNVKQVFNVSLHELNLENILLLCKALGTLPKEIIIIGCEPHNTNSFKIGLSEEVMSSLTKIVKLILDELGITRHIDLKHVISSIIDSIK